MIWRAPAAAVVGVEWRIPPSYPEITRLVKWASVPMSTKKPMDHVDALGGAVPGDECGLAAHRGGRVGDHGTARAGGRRAGDEHQRHREEKGTDDDPYQPLDGNRTCSAGHPEEVCDVCVITPEGRARTRSG